MEENKNDPVGVAPNTKAQNLDLGLFINGQYVTVKQIGKGGFGTVWQAYDFSLRNFIAVKELLKEYSENKYVEMFYKEALMAKNIVHDNIVRVQHFWSGTNGSFYIAMDYVNGVDLENLVKRCNDLNIKIPWEISTLIAINVLKALDYANRIARDSITGRPYGIVYRDISPGNILLSFDGNVKLSDFGIAKTADEINSGLKQNVVAGKYPYMSPEQIKGSADIDHRADIFSIGVVLYEMFTGTPLYSGDNEKIRSQILNQKFDLKSLDGLNLPYEMPEVLAKSIEKDKDSRYERAIEMYRDLRRLIKGYETEELSVELASFLGRDMKAEVEAAASVVSFVKTLDRQEIKNNTKIPKIMCKDFIVGESPYDAEVAAPGMPEVQMAGAVVQASGGVAPPPQAQPSIESLIPPSPQVPEMPQVQEKGKTVFEEVGDWLITKFRDIKKKTIRVVAALVLAALIFSVIDVFTQLTPIGARIYSYMNPPDIVITTVPAGAIVSMQTTGGDVILANANSHMPIPVRALQPGTYIVTALKEGFRPVQRVVRIEGHTARERRLRNERIEIMFDFLLEVNSVPSGANVFINGNQFGVTPLTVQLMAGFHTIMLTLDGFENLGSAAKEIRVGQANIDFSRPSMEEIFLGVDRSFWDHRLRNIDGENVFSVTGHLFRDFAITSSPPNMIVHVHGEGQPRGYTPLNTTFRAGTYSVRLLDPDGRYGEVLRQVTIAADEPNSLFIHMNRLLTFRVRSRQNPSEAFVAQLNITGQDFSVTQQITTGQPLRIPVPSGIYDITFSTTDGNFRPRVMRNVNVANITNILGELDTAPGNVEFVITNQDGAPVEGAFVWINNVLEGRTDNLGVWSRTDVNAGGLSGNIVARGFSDQPFQIYVRPGRDNVSRITLEPEAAEETGVDVPPVVTPPVTPPAPATRPPTPTPPRPRPTPTPAPEPAERQVIVCQNCGYVNVAPAGRRLRFCVNCARALR
ncbi:MAG: protein kinase [Elusimicrobia bacterium]|nr:protein kinase [Elusimicrobiota bacterium]